MYKSKRQKNKSFDWYGLSQRFSIRKYHFGAASVLLGTALILGSPQATAKADDGVSANTAQTSTGQGVDEGTNSATDGLKNVTLPTASTTEAAVLEKPTLSDEEIAKLAATSETPAITSTSETAKEVKAESKPATSDAVVKTNTEEKAKTDKLTEKETKAEDKAEKKVDKQAETASQKTILTQLTSEAEVLNTTAANYAEKKVEDKASKDAIASAVATAKTEIAASKKALEAGEITKAELDAQLQRISSAIEAVYAEMKRGGHIGKVEAMLADVSSTINLPERTIVKRVNDLTDTEVEEIIRQIRIANPNLTKNDIITVDRGASTSAASGGATITFANGDTARLGAGNILTGIGGAKNADTLRQAINWFEFSSATIVYPDGTQAGPARYLDNPINMQVDSPDGTGKMTGRLTMVRDVIYTDGSKGLTTDERFKNLGVAEYSTHKYYTGGYQNNNEVYEVLKEGMVLKVPTRVEGYQLTLRVDKLGPKPVATDPNNTATRGKNAKGASEGVNKYKPVKMIMTTQDTTYSYLKQAGMDITVPDRDSSGNPIAGTSRPALAAITPNWDGANAGVTFSASATYNGVPVPVNLVASDGEEGGRGEFLQFVTNGSNWEELMALNLNKNGGYVYGTNKLDLNGYLKLNKNGYNIDEWVTNPQAVDEKGNLRFADSSKTQRIMDVYGTKEFGPAWTAMRQGNALPIGFSQNVSQFSMYMHSTGAQAGTIGFITFDGGDAPESYGKAQHFIGNINKTLSDGRQVTASQPFLGDQPGDPDFRSTSDEHDKTGAWVLDDLVNTAKHRQVDVKTGNEISNESGDTGTYAIVNGNPVIRKTDGSTVAIKTGEIVTVKNPDDTFPIRGIFDTASQSVGVGSLPDEGRGQLLDSAVATDYKLRQATDNEYVLDGVRANLGQNNDVAYVRGWVDFNGNGKFDDGESSEVIELRQNKTISLKFKNIPQLLNTSIDSVGVRLRIALDKEEILKPTGLASSGEVEDFLTHVIHPPRGTRTKTKNYQGEKQSLEMTTSDLFTATGKTDRSKYQNWNQIDQTIPPKIVVTESVVAKEVPTGDADVNVTDPSGTTVYRGTVVKVYDKRNNELGTAVKVTNPLNGTTEYLLSNYTEYDTAGNKVGVYSLNKENNGLNKADSNGIYKTKIEFTPELGYVGTAKGIAIRAWDENRVSTGWSANDKTIEESKRNITLADKDKILANVNEDVNGRESMDTTYVPTVVDIKPVGKDETTTDVQGKEQSATPKIPDHGTVESITDSSVDESKISKEHVLIDKTKPITFAHEKVIPGKVYTEDIKVTEETVLTYEDGGTETFKPADKIPAGTEIAKNSPVTITGEGNVTVSGVRIANKGTTNSPNKVPAGSVLEGAQPTAPQPIKVLRNGVEVTVNTGEKLKVGDQLVDPLPITSGAQITTWKVTLQKGDVIPQSYSTLKPTLAEATGVDKITGTKGATLTYDGNKYVYNNDTIPQGTKTVGTTVDLSTLTLPNATHVDPATGVVTTVPRRYTTISDNKIVIENEGTYTIVPKTSTNEKGQTIYEDAKVVFTPDPKFVGVGTGVTLKQPDLDYNTRVDGDKVTSRYGTDYGYAKYTPVVTPDLTATIARKIHYVYEGDKSTPATAKKPILTIDDKPVVNEQTLTYNRDYIIMEKDGVTEKDIKVANVVTLNAPIKIKRFVKENNQTVEKEITTNTLQPGDEVKAGTQLSAGTVIIGAWKPINDENAKFTPIISPVLKGYTAEVQLPSTEYTKKEENGVQTHVRNANSTPAGIYTPSAPGGNVDTVNVGAYEPLVSVVRADDKDDFDVYVYYKADKQKANVVYIDLDEKGDKRVLETQSGTKVSELPTGTTQDPKTTYGVEKLSGESDSTIPYDTADTIKKYTDKGYELASDDYKNDENGRALADGRKFDEDSSVDQTFYVYLRHKKEQLSTSDKRTVTRHIEYKYADTDEVPADKKGQPVEEALAKTVTEVLTFERTRTLDMATTAKLFENEYNAYKAVLANNAVGSDAEVDARANLFEFVQGEVNKPTATDEVKAIISYGEWQAKPGTGENITLSAAEKTIKDSKFNDVVSPTVPGYLPDNAKVEATADVNPESDPDDYTVTVTYSPGDQKAIVNFVEVDANDSNQVITPGLADPVTITGKSGAAFPTTANDSVQAKIAELVKKGYELVDNGNGFVATDSFDTNTAVDQTYTVKLRAKEAPVVPTDNVTPQPGQPVDPGNPDGPKWPESVKDLKNKDVVKRTIKYVYEDGTPVIDPATGAQKVVEQTAEFTREANVNLVTGAITYGDWTPAKELVAVTSPTATDIPAVANHIVSTATVPAVTVAAEADDITETVVYRQVKPITVQPNDPTPTKDQPIDPNNPNNPDGPKWTEELLKKLEDARKEEVNRTITYKYSDVASELKADDAAKAGQNAANEVTNKVEFKRPVTIDPKTLEFTYGDWVATNNDTILEGNATVPVVPGYVATGDVEKSKTDVTDVKATDKDITDKVVYKALGKFVPVVPEGFTPPTIENPQYPNNNEDPSKPGDPTTTTTIPYVPGTTPVGPDGQPLKPKVEGDPKQGYVPPAPTTPTGDTTITYVKDGTQIAVTKFVDTTGKGLAPSVVDTGDTGKAFTKDADVTAAINKILARGYEKVANVNANEKDYPSTDAEKVFDADAKTNQEFTVTFKPKELPTDPTKPVDPNNNPVDPTDPASPNKPRDPETTVTPKPTDPVPNDPKGRTYG
ncbi:mucin-binding protein, partial [Streptococcus mitis]